MEMTQRRKIVLVVTAAIVVVFIAGIFLVALAIAAIRGSEPRIESNSVLVLRVGGELNDYVPDDPFARLLGTETTSLTDLLQQIRKAKVDKRIGAILLEISPSEAGWGKADEIRDAIADFRSAGKPVFAFMEYGANKDFYIAASCDRIYVAPAGNLFIQGLAAQAMFFRGSLDKLGIYPDMFQIGKYKNAADTFTRTGMSEEHREVINSMLDEIFNRMVNAIATARGKSSDDVRALIDNAPFTSRQAMDLGLIDGAAYREGVEEELKKRLGYKESDKLRITRQSTYKNVRPESLDLNKGEKIAVIYGMGAIGSGKSEDSPFGSSSIGSDTMVRALRDAREDTSVKAIVIRVDSPGGSAFASDVIWNAVEEAKKKKPVVISMSDVAASGGYYISCGASKIVAQPATITGSIGIFAGKPVMRGFYDWIGVSNEYVLRGKNAGIFRVTERFTPEERAKFEELIKSAYYDDFIPKVAQGRSKDVEYIDSIGQGRVWMGSQARERGLVDEFGGLDKAVEVAKQLSNIPADKEVQRVIFPAPRTLFQRLLYGGDSLLGASQNQSTLAVLPNDLRRALRYASVVDGIARGEVMALMPFELTVK